MSETEPKQPPADSEALVTEGDAGSTTDSASEASAELGEGATASTSADVPPDRLAIDPSSPHFDAERLRRGVGIRFKGTQRTNIEEYCISEGWVRVQAGKAVDRRGKPLTIKLNGPVEAWYEDLGDDAPVARQP